MKNCDSLHALQARRQVRKHRSTDYAAANSVLDAEMARLTASGKTRGVAIGWTGWQDVGMATRGSIQAVFDASGIMTIPKDLGVEIFVKEALAGGKRRVIGCGSLGIMDKFNSFREAPLSYLQRCLR